MAELLPQQRWCPKSAPLCRLVGGLGALGSVADGVRVGLAIPCRDEGKAGDGEVIRAAAAGNWSAAELAGMSIRGNVVNVFSIRPESAADMRETATTRAQLVACLQSRGPCELSVPPGIAAAVRHPKNLERTATRDAEGHLQAKKSGELTWDVGRSTALGTAWLGVGENVAGTTVWCEWLDLFPARAL